MTDVLRAFLRDMAFATDVYAAISAMMIVWLAVLVYCHLAFCVSHRDRYARWFSISAAEKADAILNLSAAGYFIYSLFQRVLAMYAFAMKEWTITTATSMAAPAYLPLGVLALSGWLWWVAFNRHPVYYRRWWCIWMWIGAVVYAIVVYIL